MRLSFLKLILIVAGLMFRFLSQGAEALIHSPYPPKNGDAYSIIPFTIEEYGENASAKFQQVFSASDFSQLGSEGGTITRLSFYEWNFPNGRGFGAQLPSIEILMGVTDQAPDALSTTFAENYSGGPAVVYSRGPLVLGGGGGVATRVDLQFPFTYKPSQGNLLLEIRNYARVPPPYHPGNTAIALDAVEVLGDQVSRVYSPDVNGTTGVADSLGLNTTFWITVIPEPSTAAILGMGSFFVCLHILRQRKQSGN
jgi:hypothetical protein